MKSTAILLTTALAVIASTAAFPAQETVVVITTAQTTSDASETQSSTLSSASSEPTQSNGGIPNDIMHPTDHISEKCLNTLKGIVAIGDAQSCLPARQLEPIWNQTLYDPMNVSKYVSQALDVMCQAPECPQVALNLASKQLSSNCDSQDEQQILVQAANAFINNYGAVRKLGCEKNPNSTDTTNNTETDSGQNSSNSPQYCLGDATQHYLNKSLLILTGKWKENPGQLCPPCADTWYADLNQLDSQYEDLKKWQLSSHLEDLCPQLKNSSTTDSQTSAPSQTTDVMTTTAPVVEVTTTQSQPDSTNEPAATPTESQPQSTSEPVTTLTATQPQNTGEPAATPTEQPNDDEDTTVVIVTTAQ